MSWVANLFNPAQATRKGFAPPNDGQPPIFSNAQNDEDGSSSTHRERWAVDCVRSVEEEEEEYPRSPYWQVSLHPIFFPFPSLPQRVIN